MANDVIIQKAPTSRGFKQQMVNFVNGKWEHSERHFNTDRHKFASYYNTYRGWQMGKHHPHKNNVHLPLVLSTVQSDVARKIQTTLGGSPVVQMVGTHPDDAPVARKREALVDAQFKDANAFVKGIDAYLTADLYGTTILQHGWRRDKSMRMIDDVATEPLSRRRIRQLKNEEIVTFDGPDFEVIDVLNWFPQPGFRDVIDMRWCVVQYILDLDDVRFLASEGIFDQSEVDRMEREGIGAAEVEEDLKSFRLNAPTESEAHAREREPMARPIMIRDFWGLVPSELGEDGVVNRVVSVANRTYLMRNRPNPYFHQMKPFVNYSPMPDPHHHYGPGKVEISLKLQVVANRFVNQALDAGDIFGDPAFFVNSNSGLETRNLHMKPGIFFEVDGPPQESIMPMQPDLRGVQLNMQHSENAWRWMQQGTGIIEDVVQGGAGQRQTAREFLGRQEAVATRLLMESRLAEKALIEPLADMFNALNKQFLPLPKEVVILGEGSQRDPITGEPLPDATRETLDAGDLVPDYAARATGATSRLNRVTRQQNIVLLAQAMGANPVAASAVNWLNFWRQTLVEFEFTNINELIADQEQMAQQMQMQQSGQGEQVPGTPGGIQGEGDLGSIIGTLSQGS
jgi:hypothetical protein